MNENLLKLEHFFMIDMQIKKKMITIYPPNKYLDNESVIKYLDNTFDSLKYIFTELKCVGLDFLGSRIIEKITQLEEKINLTFMYCNNDIEKLRKAYKLLISDMSVDFINTVKSECVGYTICSLNKSIDKATTINEFLHLIHSYIINSEKILQSIPKVNEKRNQYNYPIVLRGNINEYFNLLYQYFPLELDCGETDMVAINKNKMIMMIRDRGHALTIEITLNDNVARMEYFIPKLCNIEMINNLYGVNKVTEESIGATGIIEIEKSQLPIVLYDFISKVPMDSDMELIKNI